MDDVRVHRAERLLQTLTANTSELANPDRVLELIDAVRILEDHNNDMMQRLAVTAKNAAAASNDGMLSLADEQQLRANLARAKTLGDLVNDAKTALRNQQLTHAHEQVALEQKRQREIEEKEREMREKRLYQQLQQQTEAQHFIARQQEMDMHEKEIRRQREMELEKIALEQRRAELELKQRQLEAKEVEIEFKTQAMLDEQKAQLAAKEREIMKQQADIHRARDQVAPSSVARNLPPPPPPPSELHQQHQLQQQQQQLQPSNLSLQEQLAALRQQQQWQPAPPPTQPQTFNAIRNSPTRSVSSTAPPVSPPPPPPQNRRITQQQQQQQQQQTRQTNDVGEQTRWLENRGAQTVTPTVTPRNDESNAAADPPRLVQVDYQLPVTAANLDIPPPPPASRSAAFVHHHQRQGRASSPTRDDIITAVKLPPPRARIADPFAEQTRVPLHNYRYNNSRESGAEAPHISPTRRTASEELLDRSLVTLRHFAQQQNPPPAPQQLPPTAPYYYNGSNAAIAAHDNDNNHNRRFGSPNRHLQGISTTLNETTGATSQLSDRSFLSLRDQQPQQQQQQAPLTAHDLHSTIQAISQQAVRDLIQAEERRRYMDSIRHRDVDQEQTQAQFHEMQLRARERDFNNKTEYSRLYPEIQRRTSGDFDDVLHGTNQNLNYSNNNNNNSRALVVRGDYDHRAPPSIGIQEYYNVPPPPPPAQVFLHNNEQLSGRYDHQHYSTTGPSAVARGRIPLRRRTLREVERTSGVPQSRIRAANPALKFFDEDQVVPDDINIYVPVPDKAYSSAALGGSSLAGNAHARAIHDVAPSRNASFVPDYEQFADGRGSYRPLSPSRRELAGGGGAQSQRYGLSPTTTLGGRKPSPVVVSGQAGAVGRDRRNWLTCRGGESVQDICARFAVPYPTLRTWNPSLDGYAPNERLPAGMTLRVASN